MTIEDKSVINIFYCYAREDKILRDDLEIHLSGLRRQNYIMTWYDREISPGIEWKKEIHTHLNAAHIILLLISPHFMASDYCYGIEMKQALDKHSKGTARVIPIIIRPVDWEDAPFSDLQVLPTNAKPVTSWPNSDEAFWDVAREIRKVTKELRINLCLDQANGFYNLKQYEKALTMFEEVIRLGPNSVGAYVGKGLALHGLQNYRMASVTLDQAENMLNSMLLSAKDTTKCLALLSQYTTFLASQNRWDKILRFTEAALRLAPNDPIWLAGRVQAQAKIQETSQRQNQGQAKNDFSSSLNSQEQKINKGDTIQASSNEDLHLRYELAITFEESVFGCQKEIELLRWEICSHCHGDGAQLGTSSSRCSACQSTGEIRRVQDSIFGQFVKVAPCEICRGKGRVIMTPCEMCGGQGRVHNNRHVIVNIPAGVDDGINVRVTGGGHVSARGGTPGNLYVVLTVSPRPFFKRNDNDIIYELKISSTQAMHGDVVKVPTIDGKSTDLRIPAGTKNGRTFRLKGMGIPVVHSSARGDQHVIVKVL
jgi:DnaJ-class molecular chaperone